MLRRVAASVAREGCRSATFVSLGAWFPCQTRMRLGARDYCGKIAGIVIAIGFCSLIV